MQPTAYPWPADRECAKYLIAHYIRLYLLILRNQENEHIQERAIRVLAAIEARSNFPSTQQEYPNVPEYIRLSCGRYVRKQTHCWMRLARMEAIAQYMKAKSAAQ